MTGASIVTDGCGGTNPSAIDLFRYNSSGLVLIDGGGNDYFSADGGATKDSPYYNTTDAGADYGDFFAGDACGAVQDAFGCLGHTLSITNDAGTPEIQMLNAVGYNLIPASTGPSLTPEPSSIALLGTGILSVAGFVRRRRNAA